jgi:hypothetical protein
MSRPLTVLLDRPLVGYERELVVKHAALFSQVVAPFRTKKI